MRLLFATDLHGSTLVLHKAIHATIEYDADIFLLGGDLSGKYLLPIVQNGTTCEIFEPMLHKEASAEHRRKTSDQREISFHPRIVDSKELPFHLQRLEAKGYYWHQFQSRDEVFNLTERPYDYNALEQLHISDRLCSWADIIRRNFGEERACYWTGGNDDEPQMLEQFKQRENGSFVYAEGRCVQLDENLQLLSVGFSNPTPFDTSRELQESDLLQLLHKIHESADRHKGLVLNVHVPPQNCGNLDLVDVQGKREHVGSSAVRDFVRLVQPIADFAGHIHEGKGVGRIGRTLVFNPGSDYNAGVLQGFVVVFDDVEVIDYTHITE